jgi:hypothetical protein
VLKRITFNPATNDTELKDFLKTFLNDNTEKMEEEYFIHKGAKTIFITQREFEEPNVNESQTDLLFSDKELQKNEHGRLIARGKFIYKCKKSPDKDCDYKGVVYNLGYTESGPVNYIIYKPDPAKEPVSVFKIVRTVNYDNYEIETFIDRQMMPGPMYEYLRGQDTLFIVEREQKEGVTQNLQHPAIRYSGYSVFPETYVLNGKFYRTEYFAFNGMSDKGYVTTRDITPRDVSIALNGGAKAASRSKRSKAARTVRKSLRRKQKRRSSKASGNR